MKRLTLSTFVLMLLLGTTGLFAQSNSKSGSIKTIYIENLAMGIQSENHGLSRSSIYLAGKYKINELEDVLINRVTNEYDESMRILIALTLNEIGSPKGMAIVQKLANEDSDPRVKKMCTLIMNEYANNLKLVDVEY